MPSEIERALARRARRSGSPHETAGHPDAVIHLVEMNRALTAEADLERGLRGALEILNRNPAVVRSAASLSLADVAEVVVDGSNEGSRAAGQEDNSFVCTTISINGRPIGALAVDLAIAEPGTAEQVESLLQALAEFIAHSVHLRQMLEGRELSRAEVSRSVLPDEAAELGDPDGAIGGVCEDAAPDGEAPLSELVARYERGLIESALRTTRGNRSRAAKLLQTTERIVGYRVQQYGIDCREYRD